MDNVFMYKFEIIEKAIAGLDFTTKDEVVNLVKKMRDIALKNESINDEVKQAFKDAYTEISNESITLENLLEIKKYLEEYDRDKKSNEDKD